MDGRILPLAGRAGKGGIMRPCCVEGLGSIADGDIAIVIWVGESENRGVAGGSPIVETMDEEPDRPPGAIRGVEICCLKRYWLISY